MLKLGGHNAVGASGCQPGKTPPHDQPHLTQQSRANSLHPSALRDRDVSRTASVVSTGPRAGQKSGPGIGRGGQTIARGRAESADTRNGIGKRAETTAALFHGEKSRSFHRWPPRRYSHGNNYTGNSARAERFLGSA